MSPPSSPSFIARHRVAAPDLTAPRDCFRALKQLDGILLCAATPTESHIAVGALPGAHRRLRLRIHRRIPRVISAASTSANPLRSLPRDAPRRAPSSRPLPHQRPRPAPRIPAAPGARPSRHAPAGAQKSRRGHVGAHQRGLQDAHQPSPARAVPPLPPRRRRRQ